MRVPQMTKSIEGVIVFEVTKGFIVKFILKDEGVIINDMFHRVREE